jgi:ATP-binding cassette subfamily B protein/ATP-binding cassette subfamily C protein
MTQHEAQMQTQSATIPTWRLLWRLIRYAPRLYTLDALLWIGINGLFPALPGLIIREYFNALSSPAQSNVWLWVAVLPAVALGHTLVIVLGRFTKTHHRFTIRALLAHNLLTGVLDRPGAQPLTQDGRAVAPGAALSTFRDDVEQLEDMVVGVSELAANGLFALVSFAILLSVNSTITLLVFVPLLAIVAVVHAMQERIVRYRRAGRQATADVTGVVGELFGAVQAIKVAGAEQAMLDQLRRANASRQRAVVRDEVFNTALTSIFVNLVSLGTGLILLVIALTRQAGAGVMPVGDIALFIYNLSFIGEFLGFVGGMAALYRQSAVSFERMTPFFPDQTATAITVPSPLYLKPLLGRQPTLPPIEPPRRSAYPPLRELVATGLTYRYPDTARGIADVNLRIAAGELVVITGRVGAGKTTLLHVLLGLLPRDAGEIRWNDALIDDPARVFVPPQSAYVSQAPRLFSAPLRENLLLGLDANDNDIARAVHLAVFERDLAAMPDGLDTRVGVRGLTLSGGQRQRAAAARMFVRNPDLLVVDDLSSALDVETERLLWERLAQGSGVWGLGSGVRGQGTGNREQGREGKEQGTGNRGQGSGVRGERTGHRGQQMTIRPDLRPLTPDP